MRTAYGILLLLFCFSVYAEEDFDRAQIEERIKPVGQVNVEEEAGQNNQKNEAAPVTQPKLALAPGEAIVKQYCLTCHQTGLAGAPKIHDATDWKPRLSKGINALVASAIKGINAMPAKGTCQECTEKDIKEAIEYMLPKS